MAGGVALGASRGGGAVWFDAIGAPIGEITFGSPLPDVGGAPPDAAAPATAWLALADDSCATVTCGCRTPDDSISAVARSESFVSLLPLATWTDGACGPAGPKLRSASGSVTCQLPARLMAGSSSSTGASRI